MTLSPIDALVASWFLQSALAIVFTIALWALVRHFGQKAIRALAVGWLLHVLVIAVTLFEAWMLRMQLASPSTSAIAGALELAAVLASCVFWSPVAGLLVNDRRSAMPRRQVILAAVTAFAVLLAASAIAGQTLHVPGSGPLWPLYPIAYLLLAVDAWKASDRSPPNRAMLRMLALGFFLFAARITTNKAIMTGYTVYTASGDRLLVVAILQVVQMASFGVISLMVALALERTAILALAARSRNAELATFKAQRLESLGRMTASIAHDFNNVLTAIVGAAGLVRLVPNSPHDIELEMGIIDDAILRAKQLVKQMLDFARQRPTTPSRFSVNELLIADTSLLRRAVGTGPTLSVEAAAPESEVVMDPAQLTQVVLNLVTNARDATPEGTILVSTATETLREPRQLPEGELAPGRYLVLSVKDSGQGINPEIVSRIFEPFFTTKGDARGTGLGLATAYRVITDVGGEIVVQSQLGVGTRFDVYLPLARVEAFAEAPTA